MGNTPINIGIIGYFGFEFYNYESQFLTGRNSMKRRDKTIEKESEGMKTAFPFLSTII